MEYIARFSDCILYLSEDEQIDKCLKRGADIYSMDETGKKTLIATPEKGFLGEKPTVSETFVLRLGE